MNLPWEAGAAVPPETLHHIRREAMFRHHKWDQQVGDVSTLCPFPLILRKTAWQAVKPLAERLAAETQALETEVLTRPELWPKLGLPRGVRQALKGNNERSPGKAQLVRFDFHFTAEGWRISEANSDVPGGWNEASAYPILFAPHFPRFRPVEDFMRRYADALAAGLLPGTLIALVHATAYTDDRQAMILLAERLAARGLQPVLINPEQLVWHEGRPHLQVEACRGESAGLIVRYFPGEWLSNLTPDCGWPHFFRGASVPLSNPATALLTQSKRLPLLWDQLDVPLPTWRELLPICSEPRDAPWESDAEWVIKPALGRVGDSIGLRDCVTARQWNGIRRDARWHPSRWVAQRRFRTLPLSTPEGMRYPCLGVYTVDGHAAGAYGRIATTPLVDHQAQDVAVLIDEST